MQDTQENMDHLKDLSKMKMEGKAFQMKELKGQNITAYFPMTLIYVQHVDSVHLAFFNDSKFPPKQQTSNSKKQHTKYSINMQ